jgi:hypothetical protein
MHKLSEQIDRKFTDVINLDDDWLIETDTGWEKLEDIKQTIEYDVYRLELDNGMFLECADDHIVFDSDLNEVFVKDLVPGKLVETKEGPVPVRLLSKLPRFENMYDVGVDSENHRFYSNGILSHNTTTAAGYLLWYAMFVPDSTILIAAHKYTGAKEIMQRIRYAYEFCPDHIRPGVVSYNKESIEFDNGSRIIAQTTTETTGRGMSLSMLYCLDGDTSLVKVRNKNTLVEEEITLTELYTRLLKPEKVIT